MEWELFQSCAIDLMCAYQPKRVAVFCSYHSAVNISVLKTLQATCMCKPQVKSFASHFSRKSWDTLKIFPTDWKTCLKWYKVGEQTCHPSTCTPVTVPYPRHISFHQGCRQVPCEYPSSSVQQWVLCWTSPVLLEAVMNLQTCGIFGF